MTTTQPKVVAVARTNTALGLGLTGVRVEQVSDVRDAERVLEDLLRTGDTEIVIVEDELRNAFSERFRNILFRHSGLPLLIYCPAFDQEEAGTQDYINAILKPAVGFEIRLD